MIINDTILLEERLLPDQDSIAEFPGSEGSGSPDVDIFQEVNEAFNRSFYHSKIQNDR